MTTKKSTFFIFFNFLYCLDAQISESSNVDQTINFLIAMNWTLSFFDLINVVFFLFFTFPGLLFFIFNMKKLSDYVNFIEMENYSRKKTHLYEVHNHKHPIPFLFNLVKVFMFSYIWFVDFEWMKKQKWNSQPELAHRNGDVCFEGNMLLILSRSRNSLSIYFFFLYLHFSPFSKTLSKTYHTKPFIWLKSHLPHKSTLNANISMSVPDSKCILVNIFSNEW